MFCGFRKSFRQSEMDKVIAYTGIDWRDRKLISNLYLQQEDIVRVGNGYSKPAYIGRGLQQGYPLSPIDTLSNLFGNDDDRCYGRDRGRRKASERCALRR